MWLFKLDIYIKQIIPPNWRGGHQEKILGVLLGPLQKIYQIVYRARQELPKQLNQNSQLGVLQRMLNREYTQKIYPYIEILDGKNGGEVLVLIHTTYWSKRPEIAQKISQVIPYGFTLKLKEKPK